MSNKDKNRNKNTSSQPKNHAPSKAVSVQQNQPTDIGKTEKANKTEQATDDKGKSGMPLKEWAKAEIWNGSIAIFTALLFIVGALQTCTLSNQLGYQKKDERPWVTIMERPTEGSGDAAKITLAYAVGQPIKIPVQIRNIGKTPARQVVTRLYVEVVNWYSVPHLIRPGEWGMAKKEADSMSLNRMTTGVVFSTESPIMLEVNRETIDEKGKGHEDPLKVGEFESLRGGKAYVAVYGYALYKDTFGIDHWTTFCDWHDFYPGKEYRYYAARDCAEYNNVDDN